MESDLSNSLPAETVGEPAGNPGKGSRLISRLLPAAVRLFIQSQLDHVEDLVFQLEGKDRQILSGHVPLVSLAAAKAVYQGLHLSQVNAAATEIRINVGQMLRGKPLRLLQPFPVQGQVGLLATDLLASLQAPLLAQGLQDVLLQLVQANPALFPADSPIWGLMVEGSEPLATPAIALGPGQLTLTWPPHPFTRESISLSTGLKVRDGYLLCLHQPRMTVEGVGESPPVPIHLEDFVIDLGPTVDIQTLTIGPDFIEVRGTVRVIPGD